MDLLYREARESCQKANKENRNCRGGKAAVHASESSPVVVLDFKIEVFQVTTLVVEVVGGIALEFEIGLNDGISIDEG